MPRAFSAAESQQIRAALLEAGRELLNTTGFRKTTVEALVKRAGISKGSFYLFFGSKEALWWELLRAAEQELRTQLLAAADDPALAGPSCLRAVLETLFAAVTQHPLLRALADPDDMAWLMRTLSPELFEQERQDDQRFFGKLYRRLRKREVVGRRVPERVFVRLPAAALALAQGRGIIGEDGFAELVAFQIDAWLMALSPVPSNGGPSPLCRGESV